MNILILNWRSPNDPLAGGAEVSLLKQAEYWVKKGASVTWYAAQFTGGRTKENYHNITIIRSGSYYTVHIKFFLDYVLRHFSSFDIIIDCFHFIPFFTPLFTKKSNIIALINEPAKKLWFKNLIFPFSLVGYLAEKYFFNPYRNSQFITGSESIKRELYHEYGIAQKNVWVIHHGFTNIIQKKIPKNSSPTLIFVGRLSEDKGIEDALECLRILKLSDPSVVLWIVGKAEKEEYEKELFTFVKENNLESSVTFFGYVNEKEKFRLLQKAWILVHPSYREGWGLTVIEANSIGRPAVGYNTTGLKDSIIDKKTGLLTINNTPEELAKQIRILIDNRKLYNDYSKNAIQWSKKFSWQKAGEESWKLIKSVYEKK